MKKLFLAALAAALAAPCFADAPSDVQLRRTEDRIVVDVVHPTRNVKKHYIVSLVLAVNGKKTDSKSYAAQQDEKGMSEAFLVKNLKPGDIVTVTATCNKFGSRKAKLKIN